MYKITRTERKKRLENKKKKKLENAGADIWIVPRFFYILRAERGLFLGTRSRLALLSFLDLLSDSLLRGQIRAPCYVPRRATFLHLSSFRGALFIILNFFFYFRAGALRAQSTFLSPFSEVQHHRRTCNCAVRASERPTERVGGRGGRLCYWMIVLYIAAESDNWRERYI